MGDQYQEKWYDWLPHLIGIQWPRSGNGWQRAAVGTWSLSFVLGFYFIMVVLTKGVVRPTIWSWVLGPSPEEIGVIQFILAATPWLAWLALLYLALTLTQGGMLLTAGNSRRGQDVVGKRSFSYITAGVVVLIVIVFYLRSSHASPSGVILSLPALIALFQLMSVILTPWSSFKSKGVSHLKVSKELFNELVTANTLLGALASKYQCTIPDGVLLNEARLKLRQDALNHGDDVWADNDRDHENILKQLRTLSVIIRQRVDHNEEIRREMERIVQFGCSGEPYLTADNTAQILNKMNTATLDGLAEYVRLADEHNDALDKIISSLQPSFQQVITDTPLQFCTTFEILYGKLGHKGQSMPDVVRDTLWQLNEMKTSYSAVQETSEATRLKPVFDSAMLAIAQWGLPAVREALSTFSAKLEVIRSRREDIDRLPDPLKMVMGITNIDRLTDQIGKDLSEVMRSVPTSSISAPTAATICPAAVRLLGVIDAVEHLDEQLKQSIDKTRHSLKNSLLAGLASPKMLREDLKWLEKDINGFNSWLQNTRGLPSWTEIVEQVIEYVLGDAELTQWLLK